MKKLQPGDISFVASKFSNISIFRYLNDDERQQLLNICEIFEYYKGEKIVAKDEVSSCFYAVLSGTLNVTVQDSSGKEIFLACIREGEFFGEAGIFSDARRTADVSATDTAEILSIGRNDFFSFISKYPKAGVKILMLFVNGLLKKLNDSNKELAFQRKTVMDQSAIDQFLKNLK